MSLSAAPIGDDAIAAQPAAATASTPKPPPRRQLVARSDSIADPEAR